MGTEHSSSGYDARLSLATNDLPVRKYLKNVVWRGFPKTFNDAVLAFLAQKRKESTDLLRFTRFSSPRTRAARSDGIVLPVEAAANQSILVL